MYICYDGKDVKSYDRNMCISCINIKKEGDASKQYFLIYRFTAPLQYANESRSLDS